MIPTAIALSLVAAAVHGTWNVLVKTTGDPITTFRRANIAATSIATVLAVPAWLLLNRPMLRPQAVALCFLSATLETTYLWLLSTAYRRGELSVVYPIARGSAPLLAVIVGIALLGERLASLQFAGIAILLVGILAVSVSQTRGRATIPALLTGVAIAGYTSVDRIGVRISEPWLYAWLLFVLITFEVAISLSIASWLGRKTEVAGPPGWSESAVIGIFMWGGYLLVLWALSLAPLAVVAPVREVAIVGVALWGVMRLGERDRVAIKLSGAVATIVGVALLAL